MTVIKLFLRYYVSENYYTAWRYTPFLIVGYVFLTMATFLASSYTVKKDSKGFLLSGCCGAAVNVLLNFILIPRLGVTGAALATGISYVAVFAYRLADTRKYIRIQFLGWPHILGVVILLLSAGTLFIDSLMGQILLMIELVVEIVLFSDIWSPVAKAVLKRFRT